MLAALDGSAYAVIDVATGRTLTEQRADWIDTPVWPGSIAKLATFAGALESGVLTMETRVQCTRRLRLADGREVDCSHPEIGHPLSLTEALAWSCNVFAATMARAMTPAALARGFTRLGLPAPPAQGDRVGIALGLTGTKVTPRRLLGVMRRAAATASLREGMRGSAHTGTASALAEAGIDALAKTGTALMPNGHPLGLVIAAWPSAAPREALVLAMPGGTGSQAAALAAIVAARRTAAVPGTTAATTATTATTATAATGAGRATSTATVAGTARDQGRSAAEGANVLLRVGTPAGAGYRVEEVTLEDYVASVVTGESSDATPDAVRDALAITARTYALANRHRHAEDGFDLCRLTHCQVARAVATPAAQRAATRTRGLILRDPTRGAEPVPVFYSAACGGQQADASTLLPTLARGALPWMVARPDPAGVAEPAWRTEIRADDLLQALRRAGLRGDQLRHLTARRADSRDRDVSRIALDGLSPPDMRADDFRRIVGQQLGWEKLKSLRFTVTRSSSGYRFEGQGHGHGVGLCVFGATALAARGSSAEQLLATYFPGLTLTTEKTSAAPPSTPAPTPASGITLATATAGTTAKKTAIAMRLPSEDEGARSDLLDIVTTELDHLSRDLAIAAPPRLAIVVHPTGDSYRRATDRPWWTTAATMVKGEEMTVHLVPVGALRRNGRLRATLRHELVHVLTSSTLRARPLWVQEGIAVHYAGLRGDPARSTGTAQATVDRPGTASASSASSACPDDRAFRQTSDRGATERAYREAAACVAAALASGRSWRDIGSH